ncbi:uncharacterized protein SPAPADRAFT_141092 [Spathaspora passalidarum NRRL Y-27907]|uniref:Glycoside hydrolase family 76 protein n=1 Tax=Spathaspora passalidarum (strain NRRL Y-27907 / 11-Y1) TaxID=619300 RepID=G3AQB3_SPAPN|nr:uncharacterized protein SPAPADRAFT_141092 [Spathaspora passalidarum NRRL Y-27907]EGW31461.1 hypothetical protein SPAPADRAFT_141092 [Spathaspora passalidarum NRRL Y-27907]
MAAQLRDPNREAYNIVCGFWREFYNNHERTFWAKKKCNGCYDDHKFVIWSVAVAVQAVVDGARLFNELKPLIDPAIQIFQKYKNPKIRGYSAAENAGDDKDIYYDDDAQVASCMITAYEVTGNKLYLDQGRELVHFLMTGWNNNPDARTKGGMCWHLTNHYLNACTTAEVAKACLQIAKFIPQEAKMYIDFAAKCIDWQIKVLQDPSDKLIMDGVQDTEVNVNTMKWTYNLGTTLSAAANLYYVTRDSHWKQIADELAEAGINRGVFFYDRDYDDSKRYWRDGSYFEQLLIEGLADYLLYIPEVPQSMGDRIHDEIQRHLIMFYEFMKDPRDGMYIQSFEPNRTYKEVYDTKYVKHFGNQKEWSLKDEDKDGDGNPQKCLMGGGAAARVFFQGARVVPKVDPYDF